MLTRITKNEKRGHVHERIRKKLQGTAERPRLNVYRSLNHIYVQVIDDLQWQDAGFGQHCRRQEGRPADGRQRGFREGGRQRRLPSGRKRKA